MVRALSPEQAQVLIDRGGLELVDVREDAEWRLGHLPGAKHVPLARLRETHAADLESDEVIFVCAAGVRSETAARIAAERGIAKVYSLTGGTRGWVRAGLPLVRE